MTAAIKSAPLGRVDRKIALLRYVERLPLPDIAAQTHYSRTAIGYRLKGIEKMLDMQANLKLWVKVKKDWRDSDFLVKNFGYREDE